MRLVASFPYVERELFRVELDSFQEGNAHLVLIGVMGHLGENLTLFCRGLQSDSYHVNNFIFGT